MTGTFIGFVGLRDVPDNLSFAPGVEVGWRLARPFWGRGYATEAASAALTFGFETVGLTEIVSYTSAINLRSRRVMERLGMSRNPATTSNTRTSPRQTCCDRTSSTGSAARNVARVVVTRRVLGDR